MLKVGITGGIGSGKTTVCMVFETLGIPVYYADKQAKLLMNNNSKLKASIIEYFGNDIYYDGTLDRRKLAEIVFKNKKALEKLNSLVHPAVAHDFDCWFSKQTSPYVLEEAAIIFESNITSRFNKIILVTAPDDLRIERVCNRDSVTPETVRERMKNQWSDDKKITLADYIIYNDNIHLITHQILEIHKQLLVISE